MPILLGMAAPLTPRISQLFRYPIKSCAGEQMDAVQLDRWGVSGDRGGVIIRPDGRFVSQRELPRMALIRPRLGAGTVVLDAPGAPSLTLALHEDKPSVTVALGRERLEAADQGPEAADWLEQFLGTACRLAWMSARYRRPVDPRFTSGGEEVAFTDGFPLLVVSEASLHDLNARLATPVRMERFRPNVVIEETEAYAEDGWAEVRIGTTGVRLRLVKFCARCVMTTVDPFQGVPTGEEPLATLARLREMREPIAGTRGAMFGQNAIHDLEGRDTATITVGDAVTVLAQRPAPVEEGA